MEERFGGICGECFLCFFKIILPDFSRFIVVKPPSFQFFGSCITKLKNGGIIVMTITIGYKCQTFSF